MFIPLILQSSTIDGKQWNSATYSMRSVLGTIKVNHAIDTGKRRAATLAAVGVELLLREDITTSLRGQVVLVNHLTRDGVSHCDKVPVPRTSQEKDTMVAEIPRFNKEG